VAHDRRVRVPGTQIKVRHHRVLAAVARFLASDFSQMYSTQELMHLVKFRNGKMIRTGLKSAQQLSSCLKVHPHFDNINLKQKGDKVEKAYWFLQDRESYLLGEGQAYPQEFYDGRKRRV